MTQATTTCAVTDDTRWRAVLASGATAEPEVLAGVEVAGRTLPARLDTGVPSWRTLATAAAAVRGFERLLAPPGFLGVPRRMPGEQEAGPPIRGLHPNLTRSLNGGTEIQNRAPIMAGDELVASTTIVEINEKVGSIGPMLLITRETTFRRDDETIAILRATVINY